VALEGPQTEEFNELSQGLVPNILRRGGGSSQDQNVKLRLQTLPMAAIHPRV
jgi:hypothetical protein